MSEKPPKLKLKKLLLIGGAAMLLLIAALFVFAEAILCVRTPFAPADAVVVLGGEPLVRVKAAAALVTNGYAPMIVLSGNGDCGDNLRHLAQLGVRTNEVVLECDSISTQQNALYTINLLRARKCKSAIIVTSWFHARRSMACFRKYATELKFLSAPAPRTVPFRYERNYIASEYVKILYYALRYGIPPWTSQKSEMMKD